MSQKQKPLVWLSGEIKSPPFSAAARLEAGYLLRQLQRGENLTMPHSRPMPSIGVHCHELRISDRGHNWRLIYRVDSDAVVLLDVFSKKSGKTPHQVVDRCKSRLKAYDHA